MPSHETVVTSTGDFIGLYPTLNRGKIRKTGPVWLRVDSVRNLGPCITRLNRDKLVELRDAIDRILSTLNRED